MSNVTFQSKSMRRVDQADDYQIYLAALEWDLEDPIVIEKREDLKSVFSWRDRLEPYHHQVTNLMTFCRRLPVTLIADDVGLGKTISAGLVISELVARSRIRRVLVVCPKLLGLQWKEELESKFNIPAKIALGKSLLKAEPPTGVVITTYNSARLYLDLLPVDRFQMLILDEAHKLRNLYGVDNPPQVAQKFRDALEARRFRFVLMLTATPIHNRLWDLYSLVDLLTVARGHQNPLGSPQDFASKFIADKRGEARHLKLEAKDEFRSIVYGYMSRMRRGDAKLYFPERVVQMHRVNPTEAELALIRVISNPIQSLNKLSQISILQALTSSPQALKAQLNNMARNKSVDPELAHKVQAIVDTMPHSAKLIGLAALIEKLRSENPDRWRMVVFTTRRETQTAIEVYLKSQNLKVGLINGESGQRNQATIAQFRKNPPDLRVIVSTEAGSEGVNLQVANVLVNYDLPWNPMIVEQRIGRIQRLASEHASVAIFNIMLRGTYEEYIVGRLMEKLQLASHAIGDIEALLESSGLGGEEEGGGSFDEQIRQLVVAALAGKDVVAATRKAEESIEAAKVTLQSELAILEDTLGRMEGAEYTGPRSPALPPIERSMPAEAFSLAALRSLGAHVTKQPDGSYRVDRGHQRTRIRLSETGSEDGEVLCAPGSAFFMRTVDEVIAKPIHDVLDEARDCVGESEQMARKWGGQWGATLRSVTVGLAKRQFEGVVAVRVRATVAHDSYERLVEVECPFGQHVTSASSGALSSIPSIIQDPKDLGIDIASVTEKAIQDPGIREFTRFYLERRGEEIKSAGNDERLKKRLEDEFTPRVGMTLVAAKGQVTRQVELNVEYLVDSTHSYSSKITVVPSRSQLIDAPAIGLCQLTDQKVPVSCLRACEFSNTTVLRHLLVSSEVSSRQVRPEYLVTCSLSGKKVISDEAAQSDVTGKVVALNLLSTSVISGKRAEPAYMAQCECTGAVVLKSELLISDISKKQYRGDQKADSALSGKSGHLSEFVRVHDSQQMLALNEVEQCAVSGHYVALGTLEKCAVTSQRVLPSLLEPCAVTSRRGLSKALETCALTGKRVLPSILETCAVSGKRVIATELQECEFTHKRVIPLELEHCGATGKKVLKSLLVKSNLSEIKLINEIAVRSSKGNYCLPSEAKPCDWTATLFHIEDLRVCKLTGLTIGMNQSGDDIPPRLQVLMDLLNGKRRNTDASQLWPLIEEKTVLLIGRGKCKVEAAKLAPDKKNLAVVVELRTLLGFKVNHLGFIFNIEDKAMFGRHVLGKRALSGWVQSN